MKLNQHPGEVQGWSIIVRPGTIFYDSKLSDGTFDEIHDPLCLEQWSVKHEDIWILSKVQPEVLSSYLGAILKSNSQEDSAYYGCVTLQVAQCTFRKGHQDPNVASKWCKRRESV
ncbi:hypothetical protein J6590_099529 [Homalodisca vitripennis]|nr:hypothetical protein J6590_099529 [Homalodisca vitripennis]